MAAEIKITINAQSSGNAVQQAAKDVEDLGKTAKDAGGGFSALREIGVGALREIGALAVNALGAAASAVGSFVSDGISDAREAAKINAQTAAVLESTGNAAGTSAEHIQEYASALSAAAGKSLFGDDQIQQSENLLLTFTNIKGATLDAATAISVDMAQALGGAPKDSAIQLGKALNDPVKGITALTRVGVTFSDEQKDMIQAMVDTGDVAGAQGVILAELNKEFGGSAEAAAKADGGFAQFNDQLGELAESVGTALLPIISQLMGFLITSVVPVVQQAADAFTAWLADPATQAGLAAIADAIGTVLGGAMAFLTNTAIPALVAAWGFIQPAIDAILPLFTQAGDGASGMGATFDAVRATIASVMAAIGEVVGVILAQVAAFWHTHGADIMAFVQSTWDRINAIIQLAMQLMNATIVPALTAIAGFITAHGSTIQAILANVWNAIKAAIDIALTLITGIITVALQIIQGDWSGAWETIKGMASQIWADIQVIFSSAADNIKLVLSLAWDAVKGTMQSAWDAIKSAAQTAWDGVKSTIQGVVDTIKSTLQALPGQLGSIGADIITGIIRGIEDSAGALYDKLRSIADDALQSAKDALGIGSPSRLFADMIGAPMAQGMALGLVENAPLVSSATRYTAIAAAQAGQQVANNRTFTYAPVFNNSSTNGPLDYATANALAGMG